MRHEQVPSSHEVASSQWKILVVVGAVIISIFLGGYYLMRQTPNQDEAKQTMQTVQFTSPVDHVDPAAHWVETAQNKLTEQQRKMDAIQQEVAQIKNDETKKPVGEDPAYLALKEEVETLKKALEEKTTTNAAIATNSTNGQVFSTVPGADISKTNIAPPTETLGIDVNELHLKPKHQKPKKNPDSFVPAGTFAEAIMLGAADASAAVNSQANPTPMLFRLIADGTLPNQHKSHLKDCVVTAAVVGDISSERGQVRLERLSCTFPNGEIVEQAVEGTIFGMDAKNGVRGSPVWREGALLARAAVAGTLSGIGSGISQGYTTNSISPLGNTQTVNNGEVFKYGAAQGAANAMDKLAEYNIRRAEQYHPVIQLTAGQPVDVVFLKGFYLDGRTHEDTEQDSKKEPTTYTDALPVTAQTSGLTLSKHALTKIKQHEASMGWVKPQQEEKA